MSYYEDNRKKHLTELEEWLRIPSISTLPENLPDIRRAAEFARNALQAAGLQKAELIEAEGRNPLVYAEWLGAAGKPTLLLYGHYDVQPPDPLEEWKSPPFEPEIRNDNIYARGPPTTRARRTSSSRPSKGCSRPAANCPATCAS